MNAKSASKPLDTVGTASAILGLAALITAIVTVVYLYPQTNQSAEDLLNQATTTQWKYVHYAIAITFGAMAIASIVLLTRVNALTRNVQSVLGLAAITLGSALMVPLEIVQATVVVALGEANNLALYELIAGGLVGTLVLGASTISFGILLMALGQAIQPTLVPLWGSFLGALGAAAAIGGLVIGIGIGYPTVAYLTLGVLAGFLWLTWVGLRLGAEPTPEAARAAATS